jgi:hypothetical protein
MTDRSQKKIKISKKCSQKKLEKCSRQKRKLLLTNPLFFMEEFMDSTFDIKRYSDTNPMELYEKCSKDWVFKLISIELFGTPNNFNESDLRQMIAEIYNGDLNMICDTE